MQNGNIKLEGHSTKEIKTKVSRSYLDKVYMYIPVPKFMSSLIYDHMHGSKFYIKSFLKELEFYKMFSKFQIVFERSNIGD